MGSAAISQRIFGIFSFLVLFILSHLAFAENIKPGTPAGGDLAGTYPNPSIKPNAVISSKIQDGAVTGSKLGSGAVTSDKLSVTGVAPGTYTNATVTVGTDGRISFAESGSGPGDSILDEKGHVFFTGPKPTASLICDEETTIVGTDNAGKVTFISDMTSPSCSIIFAQPFDSKPTCSMGTNVSDNIKIIAREDHFEIFNYDRPFYSLIEIYYSCFAL